MTKFTQKIAKRSPANQQIEEHIRALIMSGDLQPGSKLPSNSALAEATGTSVFTVQSALAKLNCEGLIERKPKVGSFVKGNAVRLTCAGIYYGSRFWESSELGFIRVLHQQLKSALAEEGVHTLVWMDDRPQNKQVAPLAALRRSLDRREIQALLIPLANQFDVAWLRTVPVAKAFITGAKMDQRVTYDWRQFFRCGLEELKTQGCHSVGLISSARSGKATPTEGHDDMDFYNMFIDEVRAMGMKTANQWIRTPNEENFDKNTFGYQQFESIWMQVDHPDGLLVYPDIFVGGVITGVLAKRVSVPKDLKLVLHANNRLPYPCPLPATQLVTKVEDVTSALIRLVRMQLLGKSVQPILVPFEMRRI
ncbi:MAG: GntR family transcriptional regulator [Chthoniobacteraceae bacterium]